MLRPSVRLSVRPSESASKSVLTVSSSNSDLRLSVCQLVLRFAERPFGFQNAEMRSSGAVVPQECRSELSTHLSAD